MTLLACWIGWGVWSFRDGKGFGAIAFVAASYFIAAMFFGALMTFAVAHRKKR
jgi:hypothetical protein